MTSCIPAPGGYGHACLHPLSRIGTIDKANGPQCRSGEYAVINGKVQHRWGRDTWTQEQFDEIVDSHMEESSYKVKRAIISKWAHNIGDADQFVCALLLVICGGLESDENAHTFDENRNVIPGLYVAGNVQGDRFSREYPITLKGVSHSLAMYYGFLAGRNAVEGI